GPQARPGGHGGKPGPQFGPPRGRGPGGPGHMSQGGKRGGSPRGGPQARPGGHGGKPGPQFGPPRGRGPGGPGHMSPGGKRGGPQHRGKPRR
ncbi:MAG: hypothetical protein HOL08_14570, partial [Opitutae bacterium]|nr:hypothetical protein [Opitutae bacterium]